MSYNAEYNAMIRRGWPNEGALDRVEGIKAGVTLSNGDWVNKFTDGTVQLAASTVAGTYAGLVVSGNGDAASAANTGKAVVLWSGFTAEVTNYDTAASYVPGSPLTVVNGKLTLNTNVTANATVAHVLDVLAAGANLINQARLVVVVK